MFLHHILNCDGERLVNQVFWAQEQSPAKNDWVLQVKEDLKQLGLEYLTLNNIKFMKKEHFRALVKIKCQKEGFNYLMEEKEPKSKMTSLSYKRLNLQSYLTSNKINLRRKKLLFKLRTRMMSTPENMGQNVLCKICDLERDTTSHTLTCLFLKLSVPEVINVDTNISVADAFCGDIDKMHLLVKTFEKLWRKRKEFIELG